MKNLNHEKIIADLSSGYGCFKIILDESGSPEDFIVIDINKAFERITGLIKENIISKQASEVLPWLNSSSSELMPVFGRAAMTGENTEFEHYIKENKRWFRMQVISQEKYYFCLILEDITDRKKAEKELGELALFHKTLLETIPVPIFYKDTSNRYLGANRYFLEHTGLTENDVIGKTVFDLNDRDQANVIKIKDDELYKSNGIQIYESQVKDCKGIFHDVVFHKAIFKDSNENPGGIIGAFTDITEIKKVQNELKLYYEAIQSVDQPVIITKNNGDIIEVNDAFIKIYGYSKENVIGQKPNILNPGRKVYNNFGYSDEDYDKLFDGLWKSITDSRSGTWEGVVINKKNDGSLIWIKLIINAVYGQDEDSPHFIGLPIDISGSIQQENMTRVQLYQAIASLSELRDNETGNHMRRVGLFAKLLARAAGSSKKYCDDVEIFSPLHDIGKVGILDSLLLANRDLTDEEMKTMQMHTVLGHNIVKGVKEMDMAAAITLSHHERWDGTGYPYGLKGDKIPLSARITAIADVYDSLRSERSYKLEWPHEDARDYIQQKAGLMFDPALVKHFSRMDKIFEAIYNDLRN